MDNASLISVLSNTSKEKNIQFCSCTLNHISSPNVLNMKSVTHNMLVFDCNNPIYNPIITYNNPNFESIFHGSNTYGSYMKFYLQNIAKSIPLRYILNFIN